METPPIPPIPPLPAITREGLRFPQSFTFKLYVRSQSRTGGTLFIRGLTRLGTFTFKHVLLSTKVRKEETFNIPDIPLFLTAQIDTENSYAGYNYASVTLQLNDDKMFELCSGYIYSGRGISYPPAVREPITELPGFETAITGTNPAAGAECIDAVPAADQWLLRAYTVTLVTDANVANRQVHLRIWKGGGESANFVSPATQAASLTYTYVFAPMGTAPTTAIDNYVYIPIPDNIILNNTEQIRTVTTNKQATDNYGAPVITVGSFLTPYDGS